MSKKLVMSVLFSLALSLGGWFVSCGSGSGDGPDQLISVQLPEGCVMVSPPDTLGSLGGSMPIARMKAGQNRISLDCEGKSIELNETVKKGQSSLRIEDSDVRD